MDDLFEQIATIELDTETSRCRFLESEFRACWSALDFCGVQMELGFPEVAEDEVRTVEKACQTIWRFLPEIMNVEKRDRFAIELGQVRQTLHAMKWTLARRPSD